MFSQAFVTHFVHNRPHGYLVTLIRDTTRSVPILLECFLVFYINFESILQSCGFGFYFVAVQRFSLIDFPTKFTTDTLSNLK